MSELTSASAADFLDDGLGIEPIDRPGTEMAIVEPTDLTKVENATIKDTDIAEDYHIARVTLTDTLRQLQDVVKTAAEVVKADPCSKNLTAFHEVVKGVNITTDNLFGMHIKIQKEIVQKKASKDDPKDDDMENTSDYIQELMNKKKK